MAWTTVPARSHPHGTGWGGGDLEWPQREGYEIRLEVERATADAILRVGGEHPNPDEATRLRVESPEGGAPEDDVACADCGAYRELVGPLTFDGAVSRGGDFVCRSCARSRGCFHV